MSEQAPGQYPLSDAEREVLNKIDQANIAEANRKLDEIAHAMGYVSVLTFEELDFSPEQIQEFHYISKKERSSNERYYQAIRKDGEKVKFVSFPYRNGKYYSAEFFSTNNHTWNHDFDLSEMKGNMRIHLELKAKTK